MPSFDFQIDYVVRFKSGLYVNFTLLVVILLSTKFVFFSTSPVFSSVNPQAVNISYFVF